MVEQENYGSRGLPRPSIPGCDESGRTLIGYPLFRYRIVHRYRLVDAGVHLDRASLLLHPLPLGMVRPSVRYGTARSLP